MMPAARLMNASGSAILCCIALLLAPPNAASAEMHEPTARPFSLAPMLAETLPGVVSIFAEGTGGDFTGTDQPVPNFQDYFSLPLLQPWPEPSFNTSGSGVIIDAKRGIVLTNAHVVEGARQIMMLLNDGREAEARVLGVDPEIDIAALVVKADGLHEIPIGTSSSLQVGDQVVAIGNAFGLDQTVTSGIISALGRNNLGIEGYEDFIQVDASINPGHSGGALVNLQGELVGINTAILGPAGASVGIGFAIPVDMVMPVARQLIEYGRMDRGVFGVVVQDITPALAQALSLDAYTGVLIADVAPGTPAASLDLKAGDVILSLNDIQLASTEMLRNHIGTLPAGSPVAITLMRDGTRQKLSSHLAPISDGPDGGQPLPNAKKQPVVPHLEGSVLVETAATDDSPAAIRVDWLGTQAASSRDGLQIGDLILSVNNVPTPTIRALIEQVKAMTDPVVARVSRDGQAMFVVIR